MEIIIIESPQERPRDRSVFYKDLNMIDLDNYR